jgi:hypothetical protein
MMDMPRRGQCDPDVDVGNRGALFNDEQFRRAIAHGAIAFLESRRREAILPAYGAMSRANQRILAEMNQEVRSTMLGRVTDAAIKSIKEAAPTVKEARDLLLTFLSSEGRCPTT